MQVIPAISSLIMAHFMKKTSIYLLMLSQAVLLGCQHVPPKPLDLRTHLEEWQARALDIESISQYASALGQANPPGDGPYNTEDGLTLTEAEAALLWFNPRLR